MRVVKRILTSNWFLFAVGLVLTAKAVEVAYIQRGYIAYGGEWLTIPLIFLAKTLVIDIKEAILDAFLYED